MGQRGSLLGQFHEAFSCSTLGSNTNTDVLVFFIVSFLGIHSGEFDRQQRMMLSILAYLVVYKGSRSSSFAKQRSFKPISNDEKTRQALSACCFQYPQHEPQTASAGSILGCTLQHTLTAPRGQCDHHRQSQLYNTNSLLRPTC